MADRYLSNTMEINSILEEARGSRRSPAVSESSRAQTASYAARTARRFEDDFVVINDDTFYPEETSRPNKTQAKPKKSKKPLVITIVVILVLALAGVGGFTWYRYENSGSSTIVAEDVYVNGIALGGKTMDEAKQTMTEIEQSLASGIKVHISAADKQYDLTKDDFGYSFNTAEIFDQLKAHSEEKGFNKEEKQYEITMKVDTSNAESIAENIASEIYTKPANATVAAFDSSASDMFTYQNEIIGKELDAEDLVKKINGVFQNGQVSGDVQATVNDIQPKITAAYLDSHIVKLSEFSTYSTNNANGNENMRLSLNACNNSIIDPGETWSFNDCTGNSNDPDLGYKPAGVLVQGRSETGIGGGICQSSTTIYNAAILCGMDIVERACHYYKSTYVDAGRDATIDYGNIDLKLKNPFGYQLFMKCWMDGTELNCEIYGLQNTKFDDIEISTSDPDYFSRGYTVEAWRTFYKNGEKVDVEDLPSSTYYTVAPSSGSSSSSRDNDDDDDDEEATTEDSGNEDASAADDSAAETPADSGDTADSASADNGGDTVDAGAAEEPAE